MHLEIRVPLVNKAHKDQVVQKVHKEREVSQAVLVLQDHKAREGLLVLLELLAVQGKEVCLEKTVHLAQEDLLDQEGKEDRQDSQAEQGSVALQGQLDLKAHRARGARLASLVGQAKEDQLDNQDHQEKLEREDPLVPLAHQDLQDQGESLGKLEKGDLLGHQGEMVNQGGLANRDHKDLLEREVQQDLRERQVLVEKLGSVEVMDNLDLKARGDPLE